MVAASRSCALCGAWGATARGTYGTLEAGTRTTRVQYVEPRGKLRRGTCSLLQHVQLTLYVLWRREPQGSLLRLSCGPRAAYPGTCVAYPVQHRTQEAGTRRPYAQYGGPGACTCEHGSTPPTETRRRPACASVRVGARLRLRLRLRVS